MSHNGKDAGDQAEERAGLYLQRAGLRVVTRNYRCRGGEIDLVCRDGDTLVFVEVRMRSNPGFGSALDSVTPAKRRRLVLAATHYLSRRGWAGPCRFDVVGIDGGVRLNWCRDAFRADD